MVKTLRAAALLLLTSPLLVQCVPSQDVNSLDLRIRNLDNQVFLLGKTVNKMGGGTGADNPIDRIQAKQAEMADNIDRLNSEVMQLKGKLEENSHHSRASQSDNDLLKSNLQKKVDELSVQVATLTDQLNQNTSALKSGGHLVSTPPRAEERAAEEATPSEPKQLAPSQSKQKAEEKPKIEEKPAKTEEKPKAEEKTKAEERPAKAAAMEDAEPAAAGDPGKATYDQGLELFRASKFNEAYRAFSDYISKYPKGKMAPNAKFWLGDCYYNQQEYELAILEYQKVVQEYPNDGKAPSALLKQGLAFEKLKDNETAKIVYNKLLKDYPKSDQVETAKKRLEAFK